MEVTLLCGSGLSHNRAGLNGGMGTTGHRNNKGQLVLQAKNLGDCNYCKDRSARMEGQSIALNSEGDINMVMLGEKQMDSQ